MQTSHSGKAIVISKLTTTNLGNIALTNELIDLYVKELGEKNMCTLGRPQGLHRINLEKLRDSKDPIGLIETWADDVIHKFSKHKSTGQPSIAIKKATLTTISEKVLLREWIKRRVKKLIGILRYEGIYNKAYENRLRTFAVGTAAFYSGAGEVSDNDTFLRQLVELRVIQKMNVKTYAINQSLNIKTEIFEKLVNHIYGKMNGIVVRGKVSHALLVRIGVDPGKITVAPDTAILTNVPLLNTHASKKVGLNFTPFIDIDYARFDAIIDFLKSNQYELEFITNDHYGDRDIAANFLQRYGIPLMPRPNDHIEFAQYLQSFEFIISTRLHTNIIGIAAGVPSIPVEGHFYKTKEVLELFHYPVPVVDKNIAGWEDRLLHVLREQINEIPAIKTHIKEKLSDWRELAKANCITF